MKRYIVLASPLAVLLGVTIWITNMEWIRKVCISPLRGAIY
jgi:hypothetical protein